MCCSSARVGRPLCALGMHAAESTATGPVVRRTHNVLGQPSSGLRSRMIARLRRRRSRRADTGASAVEFALVAPVLFLVLFGIIDYGIWFADSISARQAVRDGARRGVVENFSGCDTPVAGADLA